MVLFTTGRGTPTGNALVPVMKVTANADTFRNMFDNMDFDLSGPIRGTESLAHAADRLYEELLHVADGKKTKAELYGFSDVAIDRICRFI